MTDYLLPTRRKTRMQKEPDPADDGGPAFPSRRDVPYPTGGSYRHDNPGMPLRDFIAINAMKGDIACCGLEGRDADHIAKMAYHMADRMLHARQSKGNE